MNDGLIEGSKSTQMKNGTATVQALVTDLLPVNVRLVCSSGRRDYYEFWHDNSGRTLRYDVEAYDAALRRAKEFPYVEHEFRGPNA